MEIDSDNIKLETTDQGQNLRLIASLDGKFAVEWVRLGEGRWGDYDPDNPDDREFLRFDCLHETNTEEWTRLDNASYCTLFWAEAPAVVRKGGLRALMTYLAEEFLNRGKEAHRRAFEEASHIGHTDADVVKYTARVVENEWGKIFKWFASESGQAGLKFLQYMADQNRNIQPEHIQPLLQHDDEHVRKQALQLSHHIEGEKKARPGPTQGR